LLAAWVECVWRLCGETTAAPVEPILPDGCVEIILHRGSSARRDGRPQPRAFVVGQMDQAIRIEPARSIDAIGVRLQPWAAHAFFGLPADELTGSFPELESVAGKWARELSQEVGNSAEPLERARVLVERRIRDCATPDVSARRAVERILRGRGKGRVEDWAEDSGISFRHWERRFLQAVGVSPKVFARIIRFQELISAYRREDWRSWADLALDCGFYDQSHMSNEFRRFAGVAPTEFFANVPALAQVFLREGRLSDFSKTASAIVR